MFVFYWPQGCKTSTPFIRYQIKLNELAVDSTSKQKKRGLSSPSLTTPIHSRLLLTGKCLHSFDYNRIVGQKFRKGILSLVIALSIVLVLEVLLDRVKHFCIRHVVVLLALVNRIELQVEHCLSPFGTLYGLKG